MAKKVLILPLALGSSTGRITGRVHLTRQLPILWRNVFEDRAPGLFVATPLASDSEGTRSWLVPTRPWDREIACRFARDRSFDAVVLGRLDDGRSGGELGMRIEAIDAISGDVLAAEGYTGSVLDLGRGPLAALGFVGGVALETDATLLPTSSSEAFESYLEGLDRLLALRSPGIETEFTGPLLDPFDRALLADHRFEDALTAGLSCALQAAERWPRERLADVHATLGRWRERYATDARVHAVVAELFIKEERMIEAFSVLEKGLERVPGQDRDLLRRSADVLCELGRTADALERYRRAQAMREEIEVTERMASLAQIVGRLDEARRCLLRVIEAAPERSELRLRLALLERTAGDRAAMWTALAELFSPEHQPSTRDLARVARLVAESDSIDASFRERVRAWFPPPAFPGEARVLLGRILRLCGAPLEARLCFDSIAVEDLDGKTRAVLARERLNLEDEGFDGRFEAIARAVLDDDGEEHRDALAAIVEREPDFWPARYLLGTLLSRTGESEAAIVAFDAVLAAHPENDAAWHARGLELLRLERYADAAASFERAETLDATQADYPARLALALAFAGDAPGARAALERACALNADSPAIARIRAEVQRLIG